VSWKDLVLGCCWGILVGLFNILVLSGVVNRCRGKSPEASLRAIFKCYLFRYFMVLAAFCIVFYKGPEMLVGTAIGLIVVKHGSLFREYLRARAQAKSMRKKKTAANL